MSKNISLASVAEKNSLSSATPFLICLKIQVVSPATLAVVETLYLVKNSEDVTIDGQLYSAFPFDIQVKSSAGEVPTATIVADDYSRAIQSRMQIYGGGVGFIVDIMVVNSNVTGGVTPVPEVVDTEYFEVIGASVKGNVVSWTLGDDNPLAAPFPRRHQLMDRCSWLYKGTDCKYAGALTSCDLTLNGVNGCAAHSNELNFGGFPGINRGNSRFV